MKIKTIDVVDFSFIDYFSNIGVIVENENEIIISINDAFCRLFNI